MIAGWVFRCQGNLQDPGSSVSSKPSGGLPKTRSGKIMRRLLRDIAEGRVLGDTTTLADPTVVEMLRRQYEEQEG